MAITYSFTSCSTNVNLAPNVCAKRSHKRGYIIVNNNGDTRIYYYYDYAFWNLFSFWQGWGSGKLAGFFSLSSQTNQLDLHILTMRQIINRSYSCCLLLLIAIHRKHVAISYCHYYIILFYNTRQARLSVCVWLVREWIF